MDFLKNNKILLWLVGAIAALFIIKKLAPLKRRRRPSYVRAGKSYQFRRAKPRKQYTKGGKAKKPWQVKGSRAAKLHMAKIRRRKN